MKREPKRIQAAKKLLKKDMIYSVDDALKLAKKSATAKFKESVDVAIQLGIDAKKSDQNVRGAIVLPFGTGKKVKVAVFAQGEKADQGGRQGQQEGQEGGHQEDPEAREARREGQQAREEAPEETREAPEEGCQEGVQAREEDAQGGSFIHTHSIREM